MNSPHTTSVVYPLQASHVAHVVPFARLLQQRGRGRLWLGQSLGIETHHVFAALAGSGLQIPFGSSVALSPLRHPYDAAVQARSVAQLSGLPYVAGIGPGSTDFQRSVRSGPLPKPVTAAREYLTTMRALVDGQVVHADTDEYSTHTSLPTMSSPPVEYGLGVLRPAMARAAGQVADVAITWLTPPAYVRDVLLPAMRDGAAETGRPVPRVATVVHAAVARPGRDMVDTAFAAARAHLSAPHYTDMLRQAGIPAEASHPRKGAELLVESGTFVSGTPQEIAAGLDVYRAHGVGEVILNLCGVLNAHGLGAAITDLTDILTAVDGTHG
ncbi:MULTISPECIES: LLM class flavin-dependent oxidoreductase [Streptomyces]|uniref:LLM class flavin-dependent oxidoreductase n=1 Tax=Streptomyces mirabilis TaxID=68239 RepID=A0ABU3UNX9_9ACTN|nr:MULTISPECIES: LLM class flavin-dependent oxidoreductase [Streptomyces]KPH96837.1 luciferase family protein [Actinobacteria bacterium OK006]KAF5995827.1 5,10-methylene tetrahydromethanopterin reductase [Streptomyces sp. WAC00263]MCX4422551.1 LLM class flavin-dependent oxidoreductase [Streptomyces mirabilis]MCX4610660.1 LLM class flavin-dependent oxidoreductase [Streptomyces mirabilis]MCX5350874.1 LLM class flavin-dependent oxidoreductase [Streptomyces mirabilis]